MLWQSIHGFREIEREHERERERETERDRERQRGRERPSIRVSSLGEKETLPVKSQG